MNGMRKAIAKNMLNSHMTSPTVTFNLGVDMTAMKDYREQLKTKDIKVSYTDLLVKFVAKALTEYPLLNCSVEDNKIRYKHYINMGVAVALDNGLVVPNIVDADKKSLTQIHDEVKELAAAARGGTLPMEKLHGGTFTITNLGMYGIESFSPIINQPEVAILGVTTMEDKARGAQRRDGHTPNNEPVPHRRPPRGGRLRGGRIPAESQDPAGKSGPDSGIRRK
jgi:pyruvate dehydrogenase E2 component (dihydrolipoamide acetyltransferase)